MFHKLEVYVPKAAAVNVDEAKGVSEIQDGAVRLRVDLRTAVLVNAGPCDKILLFFLDDLAEVFLPLDLTVFLTSAETSFVISTATSSHFQPPPVTSSHAQSRQATYSHLEPLPLTSTKDDS